MIFFLLILLALIILNLKRTKEHLDKEQTNNIKGIFILIVFFSHFNSYVNIGESLDLPYLKAITWFSQAMVTPFLFYSGYGIMEQIKKKGNEYIKSIPKKRIITTMIKFDIAVLIFLILSILFKKEISILKVLLSLIGWESLGNSNWYIFDILILYLITYISFRFIKKQKISLLITTILTLIYMLIFYKFNIKPTYWYDTMPCYIIGMYYSFYKEQIQKYISNNSIIYFATVLLSLAGTIFLKSQNPTLIYTIMFNTFFITTIVLITTKISVYSKTLSWCGTHLFEIYILQRIPMIIMQELNLSISIYLYFIVSLIVTIVLTITYKKLTDKILSKIVFLKA